MKLKEKEAGNGPLKKQNLLGRQWAALKATWTEICRRRSAAQHSGFVSQFFEDPISSFSGASAVWSASEISTWKILSQFLWQRLSASHFSSTQFISVEQIAPNCWRASKKLKFTSIGAQSNWFDVVVECVCQTNGGKNNHKFSLSSSATWRLKDGHKF